MNNTLLILVYFDISECVCAGREECCREHWMIEVRSRWIQHCARGGEDDTHTKVMSSGWHALVVDDNNKLTMEMSTH